METLWAKSPPEGSNVGEGLIEHTERAVEALDSLIELRPSIGKYAGHGQFAAWARWAAYVHDLGKAASGFQQMLRGDPKAWNPYDRHEVLSVAFLQPFAEAMGDEAVQWVSAAVLSHHKDAETIRERYVGSDPEESRADLAKLISQLRPDDCQPLLNWLGERLGLRPQPLPDTCQLADFVWKRFQEYRRLVSDLSSYLSGATDADRDLGIAMRGALMLSDYLASAHRGPFTRNPLGLPPLIIERAGLSADCLRSHQVAARQTRNSLLLTAPTGSGKTEAGLLWAEAVPDRDTGRRLYYVLPYQASMNAMRVRLVGHDKGQYGYAEADVGLVHGRALQALYAMQERGEEDTDVAAKRAKEQRDLARLHKTPLRVLSPYQLLKAAYRLKGYEAQLLDLVGADLIIDEIHAYEPGRAGLILAMFRYLVEHLGVRFCVMTATLPSLMRQKLREAIPGLEEIQASEEDFAACRRHRLRLHHGDITGALENVAAFASAGKAVLVCCNTVAGAQQTWQALSERCPAAEVQLLHGRFNARDRNRKEQMLREQVGVDKQQHESAPILVATQVVEVSLNISFDSIFTEPAPLDALLQRFGRVNRLGKLGIVDVHVMTEPTDGQGIYDPLQVTRTVELLHTHDREVIDEARTSEWIDETFEGEVWDNWEQEFDRQFRLFMDVLRDLYPLQSNDELEDQFYRAFDGVDVLPVALHDEYRRLSDREPLAASTLLVGISHRQLSRLRREGRAQYSKDLYLHVVDAPYDSDTGLQL